MEILFIGGAIVALMVYVSTRIKKSAAAAYEPETIETSGFRIEKPEGFIHPFNEDTKYSFEAYSKDFGEGDASKKRQATILLNTITGTKLDVYSRDTRRSFDRISTEKSLKNNSENQKTFLIEGEKAENKIMYEVFQKIVEDREQGKIYDLKISVLSENREAYEDRVRETLNSFRVL